MDPNTESNNLRQIAKSIEQLGLDLKSLKLTLGDQVNLGQAIHQIIKKAEGVLASLKTNMRDEAILQAHGKSGPQIIKSPEGCQCTVIIYNPSVQVRKDADMNSLKTTLGDNFGDVFEEILVYKPRKDFQTVVNNIQDPNQVQVILKSVDISADTPKVFFL